MSPTHEARRLWLTVAVEALGRAAHCRNVADQQELDYLQRQLEFRVRDEYNWLMIEWGIAKRLADERGGSR